MEDLLYLLAFVFFFVILPMLQRARGKGQAPPQPSRRPQRSDGRDTPSVPPTYDEDPSYDDEAIQASSSPPRAKQRTAEEVLPDDLWEILTGERRKPARPEPEQHEDDTPQYDEAEVGRDPYAHDHEREEESQWEDVSAEGPDRWEPEPEPIPVPVPLPRPVRLPDPARAARTALPTPSPHRSGRGPRVHAGRPAGGSRRLNIALNLDSRDELRRAMILREVLGPPKALE